MSRDRYVGLEEEELEELILDELNQELLAAEQELEAGVTGANEMLSDLKVGLGACWRNEMRVCDQTCMAFNHIGHERGEHPCMMLSAAQSVIDPVAEAAHNRTEELKKWRRSVDTLTQTVNSLITVLQHAAQRIK